MTTVSYDAPFQVDGGYWYTRERTPEFESVLIRLAGPGDPTAAEHTPYDSGCVSCWLGHAHSGAVHRAALAKIVQAPLVSCDKARQARQD